MPSILRDPVHIKAAQVAANRIKAKYGFYCWPSATLAQAQLESAGWTAISGTNNGFGIKANKEQIARGQYKMCPTEEVQNGRRVKIMAPFASYDSLADAYEAHAMLFVRVKLYSAALKAKTARQFVIEMSYHYASAEQEKDPKKRYSYILLKMMDDYNLYQYDGIDSVVSANTVPVKPPAPAAAPSKATGAGAVVVAGTGAAAAVSSGDFSPLAIGLVVGAVFVGLAIYFAHKAKQHLAEIPATADAPDPALAKGA